MSRGRIAHFTVSGGNEAGVDFVLIQPFLLCYANHVFLFYANLYFLSKIYVRKGKEVCIKTRLTAHSLKG